MMKHGVKVDMKPSNLGGDGSLYVDEEYLPFWWNNEKMHYSVEKPTEEKLEQFEIFELNSQKPNDIR